VTLGLAEIKFSPSLVIQILKNKKTLNKKIKFRKSLNKNPGENLILECKIPPLPILDLEPLKCKEIKWRKTTINNRNGNKKCKEKKNFISGAETL
jgi:hypothetical protein